MLFVASQEKQKINLLSKEKPLCRCKQCQTHLRACGIRQNKSPRNPQTFILPTV